MNKVIQDFLHKEPVGVISVTLEDGTLHSATVHFSHSEDPLKFYMFTGATTLKAQPFMNGGTGKAAMVIGFSLEEFTTVQMHGEIRSVTDAAEREVIYKIHYGKHPETEMFKSEKTVILEFTPTWWRYSNFKTAPPTIIAS